MIAGLACFARRYPARFSLTHAAAAKGDNNTAAAAKADKSPRAPLDRWSSAAVTAPAPKITAGASRGRMIRGRINPPRFKDRVRLAPIAPTALTAGDPIRSEAQSIQIASAGWLNIA